jgi:hypothetical protein
MAPLHNSVGVPLVGTLDLKVRTNELRHQESYQLNWYR